jgi:DNA-binding GntR family transcriptional regulator
LPLSLHSESRNQKDSMPFTAKLPTRTNYVDEVYKVLLDAISDGSLAPGTRITQEEVAEQLDVSRSPVIQALRQLKTDGLVQDAPGRGVLIAPLDPQTIGHVYKIRGVLDELAAGLAAERPARIDPELIRRGREIATGDDVRAMIDADMAFHRAVYQASGNPLIEDSSRMHWVHLRRVMGGVIQLHGMRRPIWDEHQAIADAIEAGDVAQARHLAMQHTLNASENLLARLGLDAATP